MKVFISWSGNPGKRLAEALREWLPGVIQAVEPFFSPEDIKKGERWGRELGQKLEDCAVGIFCLTRNSYSAPWLVFEAGAISKHVDSARVCPIYFDLKPTDITGPLTLFQGAVFHKEEMFKVVQTVNAAQGEAALKDEVLKNVFDKWWPDLEAKVSTILADKGEAGSEEELRTDREILDEILTVVRAKGEGRRLSELRAEMNELRCALPHGAHPSSSQRSNVDERLASKADAARTMLQNAENPLYSAKSRQSACKTCIVWSREGLVLASAHRDGAAERELLSMAAKATSILNQLPSDQDESD